MKNRYFKRHFDEIRKEESEIWGSCNYYFETNQTGEVIRQIEVYDNGKTLKYSEEDWEDEFGFLSDQPLNMDDFENFTITEEQFEIIWKTK